MTKKILERETKMKQIKRKSLIPSSAWNPLKTHRSIFKTKSKKVAIEGVGEILLERSNRAKHISLSIRPFKGVRVAVPYGVSFNRAEEVAQSKSGWIKKHLGKMDRIEKKAEELKKKHLIDRKAAREIARGSAGLLYRRLGARQL